MEFAANDKSLGQEDHDPLEGETILVKKEYGIWKSELSGKKRPTEHQARALEHWHYVDNDEIYLKESISLRYHWQIDDPIFIARLVGLSGQTLSISGRLVQNLDDIVIFKEERCALISWRLEITADILGEDGEKMQAQISADGGTYRSLERYLDVQSKGQGLLTLTGAFWNKNEKGLFTVSGAVTLTTTEELVE
jgi:hypothetical protein